MEINIDLYQHFSFDLWLTIIKSNTEFKSKRDFLFKNFFELSNSLEDISNTIRHFDLLTNKISEKTGKHIFRNEIFLLILDALDYNLEAIDNKKIDNFCVEVDLLFEENPPVLLWENIEELLIRIKNAEKSSSILSNTAFIHGRSLRKMLNNLGLLHYFMFEIFSDECGFSKPNPEIFRMLYYSVIEKKAVERVNVVHIGDNLLADYNGAKQFGFSAILK